MTPRVLTAVHHTVDYNLRRTAFSYTPGNIYTPSTSPTIITALGCVCTNCTYLGDLVAHCTPGVRLRDRSRQFILPCSRICNERHFRTPSVHICTVPQTLSRTAHLGCEYTNCTYLGKPVAHCTPGVRLRGRLWQFTVPSSITYSKRHSCTPAVRFGTDARIRSQTVHLDCDYTNSTKLAGPVVPRTGGVLVQYCSQ